MATLSATKLHKNAFFGLLFLLCLASVFRVGTCLEFRVGGDRGWAKPTGDESETFNEWASRNRFHVGDTLYFKYQNDSVLVVNRTSYADCVVSDPISEFDNGETVFVFDRFGFFYFISGEGDHCRSGQKLIVRVMVHPATVLAPEPAPAPEADGGSDDSGGSWDSIWHHPPAVNSTVKMSVASYFMTALGGMLIILYLLM